MFGFFLLIKIAMILAVKPNWFAEHGAMLQHESRLNTNYRVPHIWSGQYLHVYLLIINTSSWWAMFYFSLIVRVGQVVAVTKVLVVTPVLCILFSYKKYIGVCYWRLWHFSVYDYVKAVALEFVCKDWHKIKRILISVSIKTVTDT